jgi:class 3 adenylate cyclase
MMEPQETVQITTLADVTPERSSQFGLPKAKYHKSPYISESSSDASNESSYKGSYKGSSGRSDEGSLEMEHVTGREASRKAARLRIVVVLLFFTLCAAVPTVIYITTRKNEVDGFEAAFTRLAAKVIDSVEFQLARKLSSLDSFRIAITSHALSTNTSWPFVTTPDFDLRADSAREMGDMLSVTFHPLVTRDTREAWENYTVDNIDWLWQAQSRLPTASRALLNKNNDKEESETTKTDPFAAVDFSNGFSKDIYSLDASQGVTVDASEGPYLPTWQVMPPNPSAINYNALSNPASSEASKVMLSVGEAVISRITNLEEGYGAGAAELLSSYYTQLLQDHLSDPEVEYQGEPLATMYYPIFDQFDRETRQLVGMFTASISFEFFFTDLLVAESSGVLCVIENGCGDVASYEIQGEDAIFLGHEDLHDPEFDHIEESYDFSSVGQSKAYSYGENTVRLNDDYCPYTLRVYPVKELQTEYITSQPVVLATTMALAIMFMAIVSLSYDYVVQRRMKRVLKAAKESTAIVHSLFPANVRDRLLKEEEERSQQRSADGGSNAGGRLFARRGSMDTRSIASTARRNSNETGITEMLQQPFNTAVGAVTSFAALPAKLRLKFFLNESSHGSGANYPIGPKPPGDDGAEDKPIADLFPNCTVLFADISGFTAWSSEREPEQVFTLLQTIFQTFDQIARKRDIFKVETIGDCYVAVTGLPDPQPDHAVRMTKFARKCMQKVSEITAQLETKLGPGTGSLRMRFGLHSGPVTAGVLRGEKSRFQLFGDTVNTASRMESTGMRNRIQLSPSTAQLLIEAGKENWIQARADLVQAKGKGLIQTHWALTNRRGASSQDVQVEERPKFIKPTMSTEDSDSDSVSVDSGNASVWGDEEDLGEGTSILDLPEAAMQSQYDRLIDWQADIMVRLLKQIIAGRAVDRKVQFDPSTVVPRDGMPPLEEVTTNIELPKFDPKAARLRAYPTLFAVPEEVVRELHQFVRMIAVRYR